MLKIKNFSKSYNSKNFAVSDLSINVEAGDIYGFIGHNGAGKTTTIKAAVGILDFTDGDIFVDNISIKENPLACKKILAYIPDNPDLYESMKGIKYLNFIADIFEIPLKTRSEKISYYADAFELTSSLNDVIGSYSHGMKQKLALISALIHSPKLLVLDEPFVGLDPLAAHTLKQFMKEITANGGAIFFSTHILEVAEKLCNKIAIIKDGKLIAEGEMNKVKGDQTLEEIFLEITE
jgi:ABC-2 type transport system ATP-binding protein